MKVKNVIKGLTSQYCLEEINILTDDRVLFSGPVDRYNETSETMQDYKKKVEGLEVIKRIIFNNKKAFIFVPEFE